METLKNYHGPNPMRVGYPGVKHFNYEILNAVKKCLSQDHHLLGPGCHYFSREGGGLGGTTLSLWHFVTISLGRVGVKAIMDNVTKYEVFFFEGVP